MTTEQKAKRYDEALKVLHKYDGANIMFSQSLKEEMFPELKESEDERIRKALINGFNKLDKCAVWYNGITNGQILAWLEKQEQKPQGKSALEAAQEEKADNRNCVKQPTDEEMKTLLQTEYEKGRADAIAEIQKWSEEDIIHLNKCISYMSRLDSSEMDWLKSLRSQSQWKPSEGQLECLGYAIEKAKKDFSPLTNDRIYLTLKALKEQLLELRGSKV